MDELHKYFTIMQKRLNHPLNDLDDVRAHKNAMADIRDAEIRIDMTIMTIEEAYVMLNKYHMFFNDGNAERIDTISYAWKLLKQQVRRNDLYSLWVWFILLDWLIWLIELRVTQFNQQCSQAN